MIDDFVRSKKLQFENFSVELSQPLKDRPDVILITTSDGRRAILGDGYDPFSVDEYQQIDSITMPPDAIQNGMLMIRGTKEWTKRELVREKQDCRCLSFGAASGWDCPHSWEEDFINGN